MTKVIRGLSVSDFSMIDTAMQLGARVVDLDTGELLALPGDGSATDLGGLSQAHISTVGKEAAILAWPAGTLLKVQHAGPYAMPQVGGGKRGKVKKFSKASRRRFLYMMGRVQRAEIPLFLTLTYPDQFPEDPQTWARDLERLRSRLARKGWGAIWRRELVDRKSGVNIGKVAPHYHLFLWGPSLDEAIEYISRAWWECCGKICPAHLEAGTRVEKIRSWGGVKGYAGKYMAKLEDLSNLKDLESLGRFWGVVNRDAIPWAECIEMTADKKTVNTFFRMMRRYAHMKARSTPSITILCNDPWQWLEAGQKML